jgi:hypothetical protein
VFAADQHLVDVAAGWGVGALPAVGGEVAEDQAAAAAPRALADDDRGGRQVGVVGGDRAPGVLERSDEPRGPGSG